MSKKEEEKKVEAGKDAGKDAKKDGNDLLGPEVLVSIMNYHTFISNFNFIIKIVER